MIFNIIRALRIPLIFVCVFLSLLTQVQAQSTETCSFNTKVIKRSDLSGGNKYSLYVTLNKGTLKTDKEYKFRIYNDLGLSKLDSTPINAGSIPDSFIISDNIDETFSGLSYDVHLVNASCWNTKLGCDSYCKNNITFPENLDNIEECNPNIPGDCDSIKPPKKPSLIDGSYFKVIFCNGNNGIETAFGCLGTSVTDLTSFFLTIAIGMGGGISFLLILIGGMRMILSSGNPKGLQESQELITSAIVGLIFIIGAVFILRTIGVYILGLPGFK